MDEKKYIINIGDFTVGETVYPNRCLSASSGGIGIESNEIPWADTVYNPWDFKYENNLFILEPIELPPEPTPEPTADEILNVLLGVET